jgi:hypothetical protein
MGVLLFVFLDFVVSLDLGRRDGVFRPVQAALIGYLWLEKTRAANVVLIFWGAPNTPKRGAAKRRLR